ncbi:MAG: transposase [Deltaproteobacteria bacterium]|nr:MAG: transposase [Deltaproteobacteria bacterium]
MPRSARLDAPGILHHVIIRGIERRKIFRDDKDRHDFLERLGKLVPETKTACYAWALLPNHAHFLFRSGDSGLPTLMRRLLTGYAVRFNRRHKRHGQLFQNRYKSIICQEDRYLKEVVRYIHLNPLRAEVVSFISELDTYNYCGHSVLMGNIKCEWQDAEYVLSFFGSRVAEAQKRYRAYVEAGIEQGRRPELIGGGVIRSVGGWAEVKRIRLMGQDRLKGDERILGESDFVMDVLSQADETQSRHYELKQLGYDLERVQQRVAEIYGIDEGELYRKGRQKVRREARSLLFFWAVRELGISGTSLAQRFGMSQPGVVYSVINGEKIAREKNYRLLD